MMEQRQALYKKNTLKSCSGRKAIQHREESVLNKIASVAEGPTVAIQSVKSEKRSVNPLQDEALTVWRE